MVRGSFNLRDLAGTKTRAGQALRCGHAIRSGHLSKLDQAGVDALLALGVDTVIDFRSAAERLGAPTPAALRSRLTILELDAASSLGDPAHILQDCLVSAETSHSVMCELYRGLPEKHAAQYRLLFEALAQGRRVLFHCSAGKDRTGVASALLLDLLQVDRDAIRADFVRSELLIEDTVRMFLSPERQAALAHVPPQTWRPLMRAHVDYLDAMFAQLESRYGGTEGYLNEFLGLTHDVPQRLRARLLADLQIAIS